ncbi:betaine-aldehyde dehydrogenase [Tumebacillus avium]|uniref:Betaine-aldehyde dehydrogenase n=1 Tax=Tumebacillus avium TaxID=1903704 RepID=A0A1Y0INZ9_9BACL|nr:aldehyde dehydrogenase family protein [Tumebacillus avium]ARU61235.1 betaine-aldehyde dehydrogenase [Tumebacillus avium]
MAEHYSMIINGEAVDTGETFAVQNPATGEKIATVAQASLADVDRAVEAARAAFHGVWKKTAPAKRTRLLMKVAEIMREKMRELVALEVLNTGKAVSGVIGEVHQAIEDFEFYAGATTKIYGQTYPAAPFVLNYTLKEPVGVCAQIIPWNYPLMMAAWKIAPALAAGCTVVLKPASLTPLTAVKLVEICHEAGIPPGVVNLVTGPGASVGAYLAEHPGVDKVAFTGETETGKSILAGAAKTIKKATMELGGKSPNIVFPDADLEDAVNGSIWAVFTSTGQTCEARSRLFVHEDVYDEFVAKFVERTKSLRIGDPADKTMHVGSLISRKQWETVDSYVKIGLGEGAELLCGGARPEGLEEEFADGHFYLPTVLANVHNKMRVAQEEIFGPVVVIIKYSTEREVVELANDTIYGLAATLWTKDTARAHRVAGQLQTGIVTVNHPYTAFPGTPFGGSKQTGFGRELAFETLNLYTETKSVLVYTSDKPVNPFGL